VAPGGEALHHGCSVRLPVFRGLYAWDDRAHHAETVADRIEPHARLSLRWPRTANPSGGIRSPVSEVLIGLSPAGPWCMRQFLRRRARAAARRAFLFLCRG